MIEDLKITHYENDSEKYEKLLQQMDSILNSKEPVISNLSNFTAVLNDLFEKISWIGFYLIKEDKLYLGPFQGKLACTVITLGKGVCGTSARNKETLIVENVHEFPGHIACDEGSNSEIVLPIMKNGICYGVLDLDSYELSAFDETDKFYLENLISILVNKIRIENLSLN